jgi:indolepyruvate ferredoxin oxidoreductase
VTLGRWFRPGFVVLRSMKRVRGTWLDPFGKAKVRRLERAMIPEYEAAVSQLLAGLSAASLPDAVEIASLPDQVRGYEHIKLARAAAYRVELTRRLDAYRSRVDQPVS